MEGLIFFLLSILHAHAATFSRRQRGEEKVINTRLNTCVFDSRFNVKFNWFLLHAFIHSIAVKIAFNYAFLMCFNLSEDRHDVALNHRK